ncbi:MAG: UxaA family hydrolase, partial [Clostridia bacterium]|nr:UxaA family hydrolase [Clostridia bacterium]
EDEHATGMEILREMIEKAATLNREPVPMSELAIGLKCGGSDAFSGIVANPLVGMLSDRLLSLGASAVLTEVPEMFGAEKELMARCINEEIFEKYRKMIVDFKNYYIGNGFPVYENPSPGNKAGGITTLEEKSLGCIRKGGTAPVVDVLGYTEPVTKVGLSVLDAPGNDLVASTALGASGCQIVLFTTGRGTPFSTFVPTVKIASNHPLATFKSNWIDFDASPMDVDAFFEYILAVIEGREVLHSEFNREIAFYKKGVTL